MFNEWLNNIFSMNICINIKAYIYIYVFWHCNLFVNTFTVSVCDCMWENSKKLRYIVTNMWRGRIHCESYFYPFTSKVPQIKLMLWGLGDNMVYRRILTISITYKAKDFSDKSVPKILLHCWLKYFLWFASYIFGLERWSEFVLL